MTKLRVLLATALLTLPALTLSASQAASSSAGSGASLEATSVANCCWVFYMGKWVCFPC
jgi:hypothetical protein